MGKRRNVSKSQSRGGGVPWSDLEHNLLSLVMMKLEAIDFPAFSKVCKSWRTLALLNKSRFMASRSPMALWISKGDNYRNEYYVEDFRGTDFEMRLPKSGARTCVGLTCGYLVLYGTRARDFLLMNPITRHGIRFPKIPIDLSPGQERGRAILVFSPYTSELVFVVLFKCITKIWFSYPGEGLWDCVSSKSDILDLYEFKWKIYAIDTKSRLYEVGIDPQPKLTLLITKNIIHSNLMSLEFICSDENIYAMEYIYSKNVYKVHKLDFGEMEWVSLSTEDIENTMKEYAFFVSKLKHSAAIKRGFWSESDSWLRYKCNKSAYSDRTSGNAMFFETDIWYFPHDCLKVNLKHQ